MKTKFHGIELKKNDMIEVIEAKHIEGYSIRLKFNNGVSGIFNLENDLGVPSLDRLKI